MTVLPILKGGISVIRMPSAPFVSVVRFRARDAEDLRHGDRRKNEIGAAQAETDGTDDQADDHGHGDAGPDAVPGRDLAVLQQDHRGVGANAEVGGMAHGVLAGVASQEVPARAHDDADKDQDHHVERIGALHEFRDQKERGNCDRCPARPVLTAIPRMLFVSGLISRICPCQSFEVPSNPEGLNRSTSRNRTNTITSFQPGAEVDAARPTRQCR